jgi:fucose permease
MVNAAFWGGIVLGRLAGIPLALRLAPRTMLLIDLLGATLSLSLLILLPDSQPALWFGTIAFGVAVATMIPSSFNLAERRMPISSQVSSTFLIGGSLGTMTLPWIVGQLWVPVGPPSVMYVTAAAILAAWLMLALILRQRRPRAVGEPPAAGPREP